MRAQGQRTERDYVIAQFLHMRPRPVFAIIGVVLVGLLIWALATSGSGSLYAVVVFLIVYFAVFIPWRHRRTFREYKALSEPFTLVVQDDGLHFESEHGSGVVPWSHIVKWRCNKSVVLVYPARNLFYLVPRHCFSSQSEFGEFTNLLKERIGAAA